jgi:PPOX class probable F420-dependent enzyme
MSGTFSETAGALLERCRVGHLATADRSARPHVIPVCYARVDDAIYFVVDEKRKMAGKTLKRLRNIAENPAVALVVDVYDEDWQRLEYVLVRGRAVETRDSVEFERAIGRLRARYPQYREMRLEPGRNALVRITPEAVRYWRARPE